ncbi:hypothetical protein Pmi06nite_63330 [Planotetraspora mira]|uniref:Peptidase S8/S53 domain-containing protein n=1 Tax=Planotetraspora mira TaxID=58121 RepID=A0A8J3TUU9_9ACTN|nr:hypothetical protein Pmi06nite_63330 [Planotetraspora mira]
MSSTSRHWRAALVGTVATLALLIPQGAAYSATAAAPEPTKIDKTVKADLAKDDKATFWVRLKGAADLSAARTAKTKTEKAEQVFKAKTEKATSSQANLRKLLNAQHADFASFWIVNAVKVTGNAKLAAEIAKLPEVEQIAPDQVVRLPTPLPGKPVATVNSVEWNIDRINAPRVWDELGDRGEGVVVANIDTGVQFDHPALAAQYRGKNADGSVDHNYNWFDPAGVCANDAPCDNVGHGTHTMGTMVGGDGGANNIGVAPGAKWIAAKGCESTSCSTASLLATGQWVIAPTDLNGQNPPPTWPPTSSTTPGAEPRASTPGTRRPSRRGSTPESSPPSPTATGARAAPPPPPPAGTPTPTAPERSTPTTRSRTSPPAAPVRTARSSPTSPRPGSTCARPCPATDTPPTPAPRWPPPTSPRPWR